MNSLKTVIGFTYRNKVRTKAFVVSTIVLLALLTIAAHVPFLIELFKQDKTAKVGVFETASPVIAMLDDYARAQEKPPFELVFVPDPGSADARQTAIVEWLADGSVKGFLEFKEADERLLGGFLFKTEDAFQFGLVGALQNALSQVKTQLAISELALTEEQMQLLFSPVPVESVRVSTTAGDAGGKTDDELKVAYALVYGLIILNFMGIMITGQLIATEITSEKNTRVMEILVTSVTPLVQMFGKIIGMLLVGLTQIALIVVVAIINLNLPHNSAAIANFDFNLGDVDPSLYVFALLLYLLGYFLYATLFAAVGSIVSRTEDLGQAIMPITFLAIAAFYISFYAMAQPNTLFTVITSYIPFFSPLILFVRIGLSDPAWWEIVISLVLLIATIFGMGWLSAKIYRTGVLMYGQRPSLKELRKAMRAFKV